MFNFIYTYAVIFGSKEYFDWRIIMYFIPVSLCDKIVSLSKTFLFLYILYYLPILSLLVQNS